METAVLEDEAVKVFVYLSELWRTKCAACSEYREEHVNQDDAILMAWSHHQNVHPRNLMTLQLLS